MSYHLYHPDVGWRDLPLEFRPGSHLGAVAVNLVRARGYDEVYNLADGRPDPVAVQLTAPVLDFADEETASAWMDYWRWFVAGCTRYRRDSRDPVDVQGGSLLANPTGDESNVVQAVITLIPARVTSLTAPPTGKLKGF